MTRIAFIVYLIIIPFFFFSQEICDNGIDDDGNGMIDLNDTACVCSGFGSSQTISSLIPNSSFEDRSCCPTTYSQLNCADTWIQASTPTSDYWNDCGSGFAPAYGDPGPKPDGTGMAGFIDWSGYKEYIGACLLSPMLAGTAYTFNFQVGMVSSSLPIDITFYGSPTCSDLPFNDGCPVGEGSWVELGSVNASGSGWVNLQVSFTPTQDIYALVLGPPCAENAGSIAYYYVDDLTLAETAGFGSVGIVETGSYCSNNLGLQANVDTSGGTWQWYYEGVALIGETNATLDLSGANFQSGTYQAVYTVGSKCETNDYTVDIPSLPVASFLPDTVCEGSPIQFTDQSSDASGTINGWQWDFNNDGIIDDTNQNPTYTYAGSGTYTATLIVTSSNGCTDTITSNPGYTINDSTSAPLVLVNANPTANFSFDTVCIGNTTSFTDLSSGGTIVSWDWDIELQDPTVQNPTHIFSSSGNQQVSLKVTSQNGCVDSIVQTVLVQPMPIANFSYTGNCLNDRYYFTNLTTVGGVLNPSNYSYSWDFGDGSLSGLENPSPYFTAPGNYLVTLTATSADGCSDDTTISLYVNPLPLPDFSYAPVCFGEATNITDQTTISGGNVVSYNWQIENQVYTTSSITHTFSQDGFNDVILVVVSDSGCTDSITKPVETYQLPIAEYSYTPDDIDFFNTQICFINESANGIGYIWDFDFNGLQSASENPCVDFPGLQEGEYDVMLYVTTINGCRDSIEKKIIIKEGYAVYVPSAFTPDGDGKNDVFIPKYSGVTETTFFIFNRWGELIFQTNLLTSGWDGMYKGVLSQQDVYIYRVITRDLSNKKHENVGHFSLIR